MVVYLLSLSDTYPLMIVSLVYAQHIYVPSFLYSYSQHIHNTIRLHTKLGYGKSIYFWALVSALGTFFMGAGISMTHSIQELYNPSLIPDTISIEVWMVLAMSFVVDGYVLYKTFTEINNERPRHVPLRTYIAKLRDPATLAVLLEDGAACCGIVIAIAGIGTAHALSNPFYDGLAGVGISCLLAGIGLALVRVNHSYVY